MIAIVDYGVGNISAFVNIYHKLNIAIKIAKEPEDLEGVTKLILPGVGAFDHAMQELNNSGMVDKLNELVLSKKIPVIGVCVGMQMMAKNSDEGELPGLGWINAEVKRFDEKNINYKTHLPHMGWNDIHTVKKNPILKNLEEDSRFYFLHSYYFECKEQKDSIAVANYGINFTCAINHKNIYGTQFHPEKSHQFGIQLLKNFALL
ncbi:imidazole glycerol phosphate synthase subunit HisH [Pseudotenacibaculum sp. MALMAid0570]|uniref:imidazole glycerol phosphate synthase subunit HisH n=1 Tax=Pseudotenacibaculum sp. MALMAid0570 TaxID=3143938 RepID=UPI0032DF5B5D